MVANNDCIITNFAANTQFNVNVADLLANDTDIDGTPAITAITAVTGFLLRSYRLSPARRSAVTDDGAANGSFVYRGTSADTRDRQCDPGQRRRA